VACVQDRRRLQRAFVMGLGAAGNQGEHFRNDGDDPGSNEIRRCAQGVKWHCKMVEVTYVVGISAQGRARTLEGKLSCAAESAVHLTEANDHLFGIDVRR
jgi:hypothetical protein